LTRNGRTKGEVVQEPTCCRKGETLITNRLKSCVLCRRVVRDPEMKNKRALREINNRKHWVRHFKSVSQEFACETGRKYLMKLA